ncbi:MULTISPECIES: Crp/Fnr family transcriptional regulator [unclassified Bosea (in: a-proteobacteria)]|uniref:Crp/Fnr family transcriptional regulator n=1 Tax=unclassified Bosea (in: a-proteobacteria) TaxID=2653178 RepID=UPI000F761DE4|nr:MULTISPECIES: Crp/Fnr family transcriptional regulator [unclassified Bosea (in: a-proteobacteria)]AZO76661.1 transcriptional regulator [Bosea sp. Tri-49]RXT21493.1 transcriptional regulator [Bosea sp. Tri-39]RXT31832.1 transcriptional regulator [Bosea sp. Tri-54]
MSDVSHRIVSILTTNPFFSDFERNALEKIAAVCKQRHLAAREILFLKGDPGDGLYAIRRGLIRIGTMDDVGQQMTMNVLGGGDVFGEITLLDGQSRTADAVAMEDTDMFFLPRREFLSLLNREPPIALQLIALLCARLRDVIGRLEETTFLPPAIRLARRILVLAADYGTDVRASQEELASLTGVTRETVNRHLQSWKRTGVISLGRGRLLIQDIDDLRRLAKIDVA